MTDPVRLPDRSARREALMGARREALLDAADRAVRRDGPATSMAAVAAAAGITKPILYRHFGDKGGLVAALAERHTGRLLAVLRDALARGRTRRERVELTIDAYLALIEAAPQLYRFLVRPEGALTPAQVRTFTRRLGDMLADGIAAELGVGASSPREQAWAHGIVGMVQTAADWWLDEQPCPREELAGRLADLVLGGYAEDRPG
ncbi:MAG TPA: TetR family transcriptional regulator [Mycobacteriales bacterium]|nr:TetR family transcriptional regulator [Mycobacteriales bacterium]